MSWNKLFLEGLFNFLQTRTESINMAKKAKNKDSEGNKDQVLTIRIGKDLMQALEDQTEVESLTKSKYIRRLIQDKLKIKEMFLQNVQSWDSVVIASMFEFLDDISVVVYSVSPSFSVVCCDIATDTTITTIIKIVTAIPNTFNLFTFFIFYQHLFVHFFHFVWIPSKPFSF